MIEPLLQALQAIDAPVLQHLNPGLTRTEVDEIVSQRNRGPAVIVPEEFYGWYSWQNSTSSTATDAGHKACLAIAPWGYELIRLSEMFDALDIICDAADEWATHDKQFMAQQPLLPIMNFAGDVVAIRKDSDGVWRMYYHDKSEWRWEPIPQQQDQRVPPTLSEWVEALTQGISQGRIVMGSLGGLCWHQEMTAPDEHQNYPWRSTT